MSDHHHQHDHQHGHAVDFDAAAMVEHAESEATVFHTLLDDAMGHLVAHASDLDVRRIIDLGCGPGVGTVQLATNFAPASVLAVDGAPAMLERVTQLARDHDLERRISTLRTDFPDGIDTLGPADLVWASMVIHHIGDETDAFRRLRTVLQPDGLLAVVERAGPTRIRIDSDPSLTALFDAVDAAWSSWFEQMRSELADSTPTTTYPAMLRAAGFELLDHQVLDVHLEAPAPPTVCRLAYRQLARSRERLAGYLSPADLSSLDDLLAAHAVTGELPGDELRVDAARDLFIARPADLGDVRP